MSNYKRIEFLLGEIEGLQVLVDTSFDIIRADWEELKMLRQQEKAEQLSVSNRTNENFKMMIEGLKIKETL